MQALYPSRAINLVTSIVAGPDTVFCRAPATMRRSDDALRVIALAHAEMKPDVLRADARRCGSPPPARRLEDAARRHNIAAHQPGDGIRRPGGDRALSRSGYREARRSGTMRPIRLSLFMTKRLRF